MARDKTIDYNYSYNSRFFEMLTILFIGLKLTNYITWSWWWVLAPIWGTLIVVGIILSVGVMIYLVTK